MNLHPICIDSDQWSDMVGVWHIMIFQADSGAKGLLYLYNICICIVFVFVLHLYHMCIVFILTVTNGLA